MYIPPEICGKIAEEVRDLTVEAQRHKSRKTWQAENQTLLALTLVSKLWMRGLDIPDSGSPEGSGESLCYLPQTTHHLASL
ncbi:hypothetical protein SISSUDRAFT_1055233 [Sistotremastrum suecicum HHB10207 ss-3]|uniref:Uncharacterized protein n=1 Tax=Sistotremastrum suecicum HHB10207 ss-3 TaxID=1314776 RepID=A0A165XY96_9AGAM|nr:hypothetical protein SISSUDRAFT_1055233 [Sistotremastrum suecicum HHB10207 ss-3]